MIDPGEVAYDGRGGPGWGRCLPGGPGTSARAVAAVAAQCVTWSDWRRWGPVTWYRLLFTPGTDVGGGVYPTGPDCAHWNAYRRAVDSGLLYAEGYACRARGMRVPLNWAWCLDGGTVVDPGLGQPARRTSGWRCSQAHAADL
jgi:hypothetical protein